MTNPDFSYPPIDLPIREAIWAAPSPVPQQPIAAVGAWCFPGEASDDGEDRSMLTINADEFVELADGSRLSLRWDRGVTISWHNEDSLTESEARHNIKTALLPDEGEVEDDGEERSWHEYSRLLAAMGLTASPGALKALPLLTKFSPALHELLLN